MPSPVSWIGEVAKATPREGGNAPGLLQDISPFYRKGN